MNPLRLVKGFWRHLRRRGLRGALSATREYLRWRLKGSPDDGGPPTLEGWHRAYGRLAPEAVGDVSFSVVCPVFNTPAGLLAESIASVRQQSYGSWELILVDDASTEAGTVDGLSRAAASDDRIRVVRLEQNRGISAATNAGLAEATGDFVVFIDHDDLLAPHALAWLSSVARDVDLIYTDEDKVFVDGSFGQPFFKPAWSPRLLLSVNYVSHITAVRKDVLDRVGGLRPEFDGVQDHDLLLRLAETGPRVAHIPNILYHWRAWEGSTAAVPASKAHVEERGITAIQDAIDRRGWRARAKLGAGAPFNYRVHFEPLSSPPTVKAVVPTRDRAELLEKALDGLWNRTDHVDLHTVIVDNGSVEPDTLRLLATAAERDDVTVVRVDDAFNYSRLCNIGVDTGPATEHVLLLNNDVTVLHRNWLLQLSGWLRDPEVVAAGPKLLFPDGTIQHAGVIIGFGGIAGHYAGYQPNQPRQGDLHDQAREIGCLTAACLLVRTEDYHKVGGMNEVLAVDFQDVDFCLKLRHELGGQLVYDPTFPLLHEQSATRGDVDAVNGYTVSRMEFMWGPVLAGEDPFYSPHLSMTLHDLSLRRIPESEDDRRARLSARFR